MILYHGTNEDITTIDLTRGLRHKDFGKGFYTPEQAAAQLQDRYLDQQYYFGTEKALRFLHKSNVETV